MSKSEKVGRVSLWKNDSDHPKAPVLRGEIELDGGKKLRIALWKSTLDSENAPKLYGDVERMPEKQKEAELWD